MPEAQIVAADTLDRGGEIEAKVASPLDRVGETEALAAVAANSLEGTGEKETTDLEDQIEDLAVKHQGTSLVKSKASQESLIKSAIKSNQQS